MDLTRLRSWLAAPMASLFLVLVLCVFAERQPQPSEGIWVPVLKVDSTLRERPCENRSIVLRLFADGGMKINETSISSDSLASTVTEVMQTRANKTMYIVAAPEVSYSRIVDAIARVNGAKTKLHLGLLTPGILDKRINLCELVWPKSEFGTLRAVHP